MICTLLPVFASAQEPYAVMIDGNTAIEFRYDNEKAARGGMDIGPFDSGSDRPWNTYAEGIYSVIFDESFANCTTITSTACWFSYFTHLDYIGGLEYLNTSNVTDMNAMFSGCSGLTSLDVSNFNTENVTNMINMFYDCSGLTNLDVSGFKTDNVTNMSTMFSGCSSLTSLDVMGFKTDNVTDMSYMFDECSSLTSLDVTGFKTDNVTDMSYMFSICSSLTSLDVTGFKTDNVTNMSSMFRHCSGLTSLDVTGFKTDNVIGLTEMFRGCSGLTSLDLTGFKTDNVINMDEMFYSCTGLKTIYVGDGWSTAKVQNSPYMFWGCTSLVGESGTTYDSSHTDASYAHVDEGSSNPGYLTGDGGGSSEEAQYWMELESTLQYADELYGRARDNSNVEPWMLEELSMMINRGSDMYDEHTAEEEEVRHMIEELSWICWEIEEAMNREPEPSEGPVPYAIFIDNNTALEFRYDDQRSSYPDAMDIYPFSSTVDRGWHDMAESIRSVVFNESFANCTSITSTEYWFFGCSNLETFVGLEYLNTSNVTNMASMFDGCYSLTTLDLSSFNTTSVTEMKMMFFGCTSLTTIYVRSGWSTANVTSSDYMFEGCDRIVGGRGTQWDPEHVDVAYAHVDGGANNPGYLTDPYAEPSESEAYFDGLTAWVYGDATLDDAFEEVGRESAVQTIAAIVWEGTGALTAEQMQGITNPNLLVYVTEASKAPAGVQNVIVNGTAAQIVLTDASGNNNFFCPEPFTAQSISYTRNFSQTTEIGVSRGWETIALPFNVQSISHGSHGALVPFGGGNGGYPFWLHQLLSNGLTPVTAMEANTPYLICMPNNTVYPSAYNQAGSVTFASSNVTVPRTEPREAFGANVILMPAFQNLSAGSDIFTLNVGAARDSYAEGSVFISNYSNVRPFQAYVRHSSQARGTDEIQYIPLTSIGGGDDTTAIMEIIQPAANGTGDWYSLDGRKLSAKPTQKGIYIQNGKKIVIK